MEPLEIRWSCGSHGSCWAQRLACPLEAAQVAGCKRSEHLAWEKKERQSSPEVAKEISPSYWSSWGCHFKLPLKDFTLREKRKQMQIQVEDVRSDLHLGGWESGCAGKDAID